MASSYFVIYFIIILILCLVFVLVAFLLICLPYFLLNCHLRWVGAPPGNMHVPLKVLGAKTLLACCFLVLINI
jgi:hypothetical protein